MRTNHPAPAPLPQHRQSLASAPLPAPPVPVNNGAIVVLNLPSLGDTALAQLGRDHAALMQGNPLYPAPLPSDSAFASLLAEYAAAITAFDQAQAAAQKATAVKNAARNAFANALRQRASYVQIASNSNTAAIHSSGLPVKRQRRPQHQLPAPGSFRTTLGSVAGHLSLLWSAVPGNKGYLIRWHRLSDDEAHGWTLQRHSRPRLDLADLEIGATYVFQIATAGGTGGQSPWSPELRRTIG